jgi:Tol biopolymer transport system component
MRGWYLKRGAVSLAACLVLLFCHGCLQPPRYDPHKFTKWADNPHFEIFSASFSPDGYRLAVKYKDHGLGNRTGVYLMNANGQVIKRLCLSRPDRYCWGPVFSPNGYFIAFGRMLTNNGSDIYIGYINGKIITRVTRDSMLESFWTFSQDGNRLYFVRFKRMDNDARLAWNRFIDADILFVDLKTGNEHSVAIDQYYRIRSLSILPGEKYYIIYTNKYRKEGHFIWKVHILDPQKRTPVIPDLAPFAKQPMRKGSSYEKVTRKLPETNIENAPTEKTTWEMVPIRYLDIHAPVFSRDCSLFAFKWAKPGELNRKLYVCNMRTMKTIIIDTPEHHETPMDISWDNKKILFTTSASFTRDGLRHKAYNLWIANTDGTGLKKINPDFSEYYKKYPHRKPEVQTKSQPAN